MTRIITFAAILQPIFLISLFLSFSGVRRTVLENLTLINEWTILEMYSSTIRDHRFPIRCQNGDFKDKWESWNGIRMCVCQWEWDSDWQNLKIRRSQPFFFFDSPTGKSTDVSSLKIPGSISGRCIHLFFYLILSFNFFLFSL